MNLKLFLEREIHMKILKIDKKENEILCIPENLDDLWHLEKIIDKNDIVYGSSDRKIKPSKEGEKTIRQKIFVELQVTDVHFQEFSENLRINGIIIGGRPEEYIELKSHHSLELVRGEKIKIRKETLKKWQIDRLRKAENASAANQLLVILIDDEAAELAYINPYEISRKALIKEPRRGKRYAEEKSDYFDKIFEKLTALQPKKILIAGPGFVKENLKKFIENKKIKGYPQVLLETVSYTGEPGFKELLGSGKLQVIEQQLQLTKETQIIEEFLKKASKQFAEYGKEHIQKALEVGAVETLLVSERHFLQNREETEKILDLAEKNGANIEIISAKNPQEKTIHGYGGIVAILRYKLE
jgi:protein pelota